MNKPQWETIARDFSRIDDTRIRVVFPEVLRVVQSHGCRDILDFGCGDGVFAKLALDSDIMSVDLFDPSAPMRALARPMVTAFPGRARLFGKKAKIPHAGYDAVIWNAVWMCLKSRAECQAALTASVDAMRQDGLFVASVSHPGFLDHEFSTYRTSFKVRDYLKQGSEYKVTMFDGRNSIQFIDYHWSLGEMIRQMHHAGLQLRDLIEIGDKRLDDVRNGVPWLLFVAVRMK